MKIHIDTKYDVGKEFYIIFSWPYREISLEKITIKQIEVKEVIMREGDKEKSLGFRPYYLFNRCYLNFFDEKFCVSEMDIKKGLDEKYLFENLSDAVAEYTNIAKR